MVDNLQAAFDRLTEKYIHRVSSSDEEIAVEYQIPTPSRKHKLKSSESPTRHKRKKTKSHSDHHEPKSSSSQVENHHEDEENETESKKRKESHKKHDKGKKKRRGHHRHGKHSKNHKKNSRKSGHDKKHSKKQKHSKDKDRESKKSKQKKKKSKHHDSEPPEDLKRSASQESLESSNRSRSASPLPSIHTPSPSPTELDKTEKNEQVTDPDFLKDKFDKIKERRRHTTKEAWDSLFDFKQKIDSHKQNISIPDKDKNKKLRETIEKLKAKNEKYTDSALYKSLFAGGVLDKSSKEDRDDEDFSDDDTESEKTKPGIRRTKRSCAKSVSASKALEQAVKDISKWLDDAPKGSALSSPCDSPAQTISTEEHDNSRFDDEFSLGEKPTQTRKEGRKRPSSRDTKTIKRREIQRTIDRLQPGKSKGNLLTNISNKNSEKFEETEASPSTSTKTRDSFKEESSPKLSLGSVLPTVEFTLGKDHNFTNEDAKSDVESEVIKTTEVVKEVKPVEEKPVETKIAEIQVTIPTKKDAEVETEPQIIMKPSQEKATPNLSAWFKAFGAPKTTSITTAVKKKTEKEVETEEKPVDSANNDTATKIASPKNAPVKFDSPNDPNSPLPDSDDSPHLSVSVTPRQRRTSTGSSISERSSFSQDLDSPRHQMSHNSPLLRSPASPRTDDFQKITYPIINGTVRAGFYQDTTSLKSSPEKSCSPREAPQSPYSPYSQHVYASNNATGSATPNYFVDHNKSPLPTYGQNAPPYYDTSKVPVVNKPVRGHDDYTSLGPDSYTQNNYNGQYSPLPSPYPPTHSNYSQPQISPQPIPPIVQQPNSTQITSDPKTSLFPVKKRTFEPEQIETSKKIPEKDNVQPAAGINDYSKVTQTLHPVQTISSTSVDDIALALSEKSELAKLNNMREKASIEYAERHHRDRENLNNNEPTSNDKKESHDLDSTKASGKKENVDMINMGYADNRRHNIEQTEIDYSNREHKSTVNTQQKGYEIEAIAINLGIHNQQLSKPLNKPTVCLNNTTPAHSHERTPVDITINYNIAHAHQNQYEGLPTNQSISNFSLNDIELANKKLYACNTTSSPALDYGNWKMSNQIRKPETLPSDYSAAYSASNDEKLKSSDTISNSTALNYNKNIQQQYSNYNNIPRTNTSRTQDPQQNISSELRIPNPRSLLKSDALSAISSISENDALTKNIESLSKSQKTEKLAQNHPLVSSSLPYKAPYSSHSSIPIESLRNLPSIPQMLERFTNDERYLSSFASGSSSLYHDKAFQMAQMFNKSISPDVHPASSSVGIYSQAPITSSKDNIYKNSPNVTNTQIDQKKTRRKKTSESKPTQVIGTQQYHNTASNSDVLTSVKTSMMPTSPFNFGTTTNMALSGMYGDNGGFTIDDFRNSTNQLMAANYMAAAVAHQRNSEANAEKLAKPAHQNSNHSAGTFPFLGHSQVRAGYPFVSTETSSPLYQQYLRYQEELQRQTGAQIMSLYPQAYAPATLGVRQPYDSINRPSWL